MKHCAMCKFDSREALVCLPAVMRDLRTRGERVSIRVPLENDMHPSCIIKLRDRIRGREVKRALT